MSTERDIIYNDNPTWDEYLNNIPIYSRRTVAKNSMIRTFTRAGFMNASTLLDLDYKELQYIPGLSQNRAKMFHDNNMKFRFKGCMRNIEDLMDKENVIEIVSSGSDNLDEVLPGGGFETASIYEIVGGPVGKTQLCLSIACNTMRMKKHGGNNRSVLWLDSQRDFHTDRLFQVAGDLTLERLKKRFYYSNITSVDELDYILDDLGKEKWENIGCLVIDSLILLIKQQYPINGINLKNLMPMRDHLVILFRKLRNLCRRYNLLILYTNTLHEIIGESEYFGPKLRPEGQVEMEHGTDMRLLLDKPTRNEKDAFGMPRNERGTLIRVRIQNSNRIPERKGFFTIKVNGCSGTP